MTCQDIITQFLSTLQQYDVDKSGTISQIEASRANVDYFAGNISQAQANAVLYAFQNNCTFPIPTIACTTISGTITIT